MRPQQPVSRKIQKDGKKKRKFIHQRRENPCSSMKKRIRNWRLDKIELKPNTKLDQLHPPRERQSQSGIANLGICLMLAIYVAGAPSDSGVTHKEGYHCWCLVTEYTSSENDSWCIIPQCLSPWGEKCTWWRTMISGFCIHNVKN